MKNLNLMKMNKKKPMLKNKITSTFCSCCGDILDDLAQYNLCFDCWQEHIYEMEEEVLEMQDKDGFFPPDFPISTNQCHCR